MNQCNDKIRCPYCNKDWTEFFIPAPYILPNHKQSSLKCDCGKLFAYNYETKQIIREYDTTRREAILNKMYGLVWGHTRDPAEMVHLYMLGLANVVTGLNKYDKSECSEDRMVASATKDLEKTIRSLYDKRRERGTP